MKALGRLLGFALVLLPIVAAAQAYPQRAIRIVAPYSPGATTDLLSRTVAQKLSEAWGQAVTVENRPGASGMIGAEAVVRAAPDGYTLLMASTAEVAINQNLYARMTYDPVKDLAPVTLAGITPLILVIHPSIPAQSLQELIALARAKPGRLTFASPGNGSVQHLSGELLKILARIDMVHVPYKGGAPAVTDLLAGQVSMFFAGMPPAMPHVKAGKLRAIAVTTTKRSPAAPEVRTMEEAGVPGFDITNWFGVFVPAGTPKPIIAKLAGEIGQALLRPEVKESLTAQGVQVGGTSTEDFSSFYRAEILKYAKIIKDSGARAE
jgi:tripartite-type tricarboxylate transporter receptor subunit TctC